MIPREFNLSKLHNNSYSKTGKPTDSYTLINFQDPIISLFIPESYDNIRRNFVCNTNDLWFLIIPVPLAMAKVVIWYILFNALAKISYFFGK